MAVLDRNFFNLCVFDIPLSDFIFQWKTRSPEIKVKRINLVFPDQPYRADCTDTPLLLWSPKSQPAKTAFMPHVSSGDYFVWARANWTSFVSCRSTRQHVDYPINEFQLNEFGVQKRFVRAFRDDEKWDFFEKGVPLEFENIENYSLRRVKDRLKRNDILLYFKAWGADLTDPSFWKTEVLAFTLQ